MKNSYLKVFVDWGERYQKLSDAEFGRLVRAAIAYKASGSEPELNGREELMWDGIKIDIDRDNERYNAACQAKSEAGKRGAEARWNNTCHNDDGKNNICHLPYGKNGQDKDNDKDKDKEIKETTPNGVEKKSAPRFTPPTVEEVRAYCLERRNGVDPVRFCDFYAANGWRQGRGKPIVDWRACVRTWERDEPRSVNGQPSSSKSKYDKVKKN